MAKKVAASGSKTKTRRAMKADTRFVSRSVVEKMFDAALEIVRGKGFWDIHTHLSPWVEGAGFNDLAFFGPRRAVAYHYTYGRVFAEGRFSDKALKNFVKLSLNDQSRWLIGQLCSGGQEVCEASAGLVTMAHKLGVRTETRCLGTIFNDWVKLADSLTPSEYTDLVFENSPVNRVVATNSIFSRVEYDQIYSQADQMELWDRERFGFALRLDELIHQRKKNGTLKPEFAKLAAEMGFAEAAGDIRKKSTQRACLKLVKHWVSVCTVQLVAPFSLSGFSFKIGDEFQSL